RVRNRFPVLDRDGDRAGFARGRIVQRGGPAGDRTRQCRLAHAAVPCIGRRINAGRRATGDDKVRLAREGDMLNGMMVLVVAVAVLAALWIIVLYGSTYFGPKTD